MNTREASLLISAQLDQLRAVSDFVRELAQWVGFSASDLNQIELAVCEACTNIVQHAYAHQPSGQIHIRARAEQGQRIVITLMDTGAAFDPQAVPEYDPRQVNGRDDQVRGLGLFLIQRMMDSVHFEFRASGSEESQLTYFNRLTLTKNL